MAEAGDTAVVGGGREEAGDGHHMGGNSYGFLEMEKIKHISHRPLVCEGILHMEEVICRVKVIKRWKRLIVKNLSPFLCPLPRHSVPWKQPPLLGVLLLVPVLMGA